MQDNYLDPFFSINLGAVTVTEGSATAPLVLALPVIVSLVISILVIPVMVRFAPVFGMMDLPDPRKVHALPIPRVGGTGIFIGTMMAVLLLLPVDKSMLAYALGALVLFGFGTMDDCKEMGHYVKFIGQFIAVITVVYFGDVYVTLLPFMGGEPVSEVIGKPFTVVAIVGMINAINHSDGLDGLAGGESLLSLAGIAYLAHISGGDTVAIMALAAIGGLLGFMRFNTHPAKIFMGDGGSQFLGYTLGFLVVLLTQEVNAALSPVTALLLLGLPIADILAVFIQRIYHKMNWFRASRNHIHHRLLDLGFHHYESVMVIYAVQALLVFFALSMPYGSDTLLLMIYLVIVLALFLCLYISELNGWRLREQYEASLVDLTINSASQSRRLLTVAYGLLKLGISFFLLAGAYFSTNVPVDFVVGAVGLLALLMLRLLLGSHVWFLPIRLLAYVTIVFIVYLLNIYQPEVLVGADPYTYIFFTVLVTAIFVIVRIDEAKDFSVTPMDFLIALVVTAVAVMSKKGAADPVILAIVMKSIILFYGCELLLSNMKSRWNVFTIAIMASLSIICIRGVNIYL